MKRIIALGAMIALLAGAAAAQDPVTVGGAPMYSNQNIIENAVNSKDHTTLVAAVKAAGGTARVAIADVSQSNGVIHVIDKVLMP